MAPEKDEDFKEGKPTLDFGDFLNFSMAASFDFKRCIFLFIRAVANDKTHLMQQVCELTMLNYRMSELTGFGLVYEQILVKRSYLLAWQELTAHTPYLIAAVKIFESFGNDSPYCKFLYTNDNLKEFQQTSIGIFVSIAFDKAYLGGKSSLKNYEGVNTANLNTQISQKCRENIEAFSGAETHQVHDILAEVLYDHKSDCAKESLDYRHIVYRQY